MSNEEAGSGGIAENARAKRRRVARAMTIVSGVGALVAFGLAAFAWLTDVADRIGASEDVGWLMLGMERENPFVPSDDPVEWLLSTPAHPALSTVPLVPIGVGGALTWRPADTSWLGSPLFPLDRLVGEPPPAARPVSVELALRRSQDVEPSATDPDPPLTAIQDAWCSPPPLSPGETAPAGATDCLISGGQGVWRTVDGGRTWTDLTGPFAAGVHVRLVLPTSQQPLTVSDNGPFFSPGRLVGLTDTRGTNYVGYSVDGIPDRRPHDVAAFNAADLAPASCREFAATSFDPGIGFPGVVVVTGGLREERLRQPFLVGDRTGRVLRVEEPLDRCALFETGADAPIANLAVGRFGSVDLGGAGFAATAGAVVGGRVASRPGLWATDDNGATWQALPYRNGAAPIFYIAAGLTSLAFLAFAFAWRPESRDRGEPLEAETAAGFAIPDRPLTWSDADALGLKPVAQAFSDLLRHRGTLPSITIAIDAPWGAGKTSLMSLVAEDLRRHGGRPVWFNAWHHQSESSLLVALMESINREGIPSATSVSGLLFRLRLLVRRRDRLKPFLLVIALVFAAALLLERSAVLPETIAGLGALELSGWAALVTIVGFVLTHLQALSSSSGAMVAQVRSAFGVGRYVEEVGLRHRFARDFGEITRILAAGERMTIFIDDLDRCAPETVRALLETVNFLATSGDCFLVLGIERKAVLTVLRKTYEDDAERYLEKIFTMEERLPPLTAAGLAKLTAREEAQPGRSDPHKAGRFERILVEVARWADRWLLASGLALLVAIGAWTYLSDSSSWTEGDRSNIAQPARPDPGTGDALDATGQPQLEEGPAATDAPDAVTRLDATPSERPSRQNVVPLATSLLLLLLVAAGGVAFVVARGALPALRGEDDSPEFVRALAAWSALVHADNPTPRAFKRFQNRARFACLRARAYEERLPEPLVVALAALDEVFPDLLDGVVTDVASTLAARPSRGRLADVALTILADAHLPIERRMIERYRQVAGGAAFRGGAAALPKDLPQDLPQDEPPRGAPSRAGGRSRRRS